MEYCYGHEIGPERGMRTRGIPSRRWSTWALFARTRWRSLECSSHRNLLQVGSWQCTVAGAGSSISSSRQTWQMRTADILEWLAREASRELGGKSSWLLSQILDSLRYKSCAFFFAILSECSSSAEIWLATNVSGEMWGFEYYYRPHSPCVSGSVASDARWW